LRFLTIGDLHLGKGLDVGKPATPGSLPSRTQDRLNLLSWCLQKAQEHKATHLVFTGDVFEDVKPDYSLVELLFKFLNQCNDQKLQVVIVVGNHELRRTGTQYFTVLDLVTSANFTHVQVVKDLKILDLDSNTQLLLIPYRERGSFDTDINTEAVTRCSAWIQAGIASMTAPQRVAVGHLTLQGSLYVGDEISDLARELIMPFEAFSGLDYVWMGHVHKPQVLQESPYLAHVGSLDISDFGETDQTKIVVLFDTETKKMVNIPVPTRNFRKIQLDVPDNLDSPEDWIKTNLKEFAKNTRLTDSIFRVELNLPTKYSSINRKSIEEEIYKLGIHHLERLSEKRPIQSVADKKTTLDASVTPQAAFLLWAERYAEPFKSEFIQASQDLLAELELN